MKNKNHAVLSLIIQVTLQDLYNPILKVKDYSRYL